MVREGSDTVDVVTARAVRGCKVDVGGLADLVRQRARNFFGRPLEESFYLEHFGVDNVDIRGIFHGCFRQKPFLS